MKSFCYVLILASSVGCAQSGGWERHVPSEPAARRALDAALTAWKSGHPPGALTDESPNVQFADPNRKPGQKLVGYEILGEAASNGQRGFLVELHLENPQEEPKVRFCVLGIDPLWVMRQDELDMLAHWECGQPGEKEKKK